MAKYIPYQNINRKDTLIIDGLSTEEYCLSHWKGMNNKPDLAADTSAEMVLKALQANHNCLNVPFVTATHYDIDGFIGIWAIHNPELALEYYDLLAHIAHIGDFREIDYSNPNWEQALKIVCWLDICEQKNFYEPFGAENEFTASAAKFEWFLNNFTDVLLNTDQYTDVFNEMYRITRSHIDLMKSSITTVNKLNHLGLSIIKTRKPLSYYALFSETKGTDMVLCIYEGNRYELEFKYTTWVDIVSRPVMPRFNLDPLIKSLQSIETYPYTWSFEKITDTGPILRLETLFPLEKSQRFAHPVNRPIHPSSIGPEIIEQQCVNFIEEKLKNINPKNFWTWEEYKAL